MADISIEIAGRPVNLSERDIARFWSKVDKSDLGGCWPWTGSTNGAKRGVMLLARRPVYAPQLSLVIAGKSRPWGMYSGYIANEDDEFQTEVVEMLEAHHADMILEAVAELDGGGL